MAALSTFALAAAPGCGEPFGSGSGGAGATTSSTTSASSTGSAGGAGGDAATSSSSGMGGGGGGAPCTDGSCGDGQFCAPDGQCAACSDFSFPLEFAAPEALEISPDSGPASPRVRQGTSSLEMVFAAVTSGDNFDIASSTHDGTQWLPGMWVMPVTPINTGTPETGPLLLPPGIGLPGLPGVGTENVLLFTAFDANFGRKIFAADMVSGVKVQLSDVNSSDIGAESYSIAVAYDALQVRYWYMNKHLVGSPSVAVVELVTEVSGEPAPHEITTLTLSGGCVVNPTDETDLAPWATANGGLLLFQHPPCVGALVQRIFHVALNDAGFPIGEAKQPAIDTVADDKALITPSLSPDSCMLYFASDYQGEKKLYQARRK